MRCSTRVNALCRRSLLSATTSMRLSSCTARTHTASYVGSRCVYAVRTPPSLPSPPPPPSSLRTSSRTTHHQLVLLAAKNDWAKGLDMIGVKKMAPPDVREGTQGHNTNPTSTTPTAASGRGTDSNWQMHKVECFMCLLLFYGHGNGAYAVWQAAERAALDDSRGVSHASMTSSSLALGGRGLILQLAAYALLVDRVPTRARDVLLLDSWIDTSSAASGGTETGAFAHLADTTAPTSSTTAAWETPLIQLLEACLAACLEAATVPPPPTERVRADRETDEVGERAWRLARMRAVDASSNAPPSVDFSAAVACLTRLYAHRYAHTHEAACTGLARYRDLVQHVLVPLRVVKYAYPFAIWDPSTTPAAGHSLPGSHARDGIAASDAAHPQNNKVEWVRRLRLQLQLVIDTGDWEQALRLIHTPVPTASFSFAEPPLRALRLSLTACEAVDVPGSAWCGALWAWAHALPRCTAAAAQRRPHRFSGEGSHTARKTSRQQRQHRADARAKPRSERNQMGLTHKEAGRVLTILAHAGRGAEAQDLFYTLPAALVDEYNVVQVAFALSAAAKSSSRAGSGPDLLRLWAAWRCKVGPSVVPTTRLTTAMIRCGARGSAEDAQAMVTLATLGARQSLQRAEASATSLNAADGESLPIDFKATEGDLVVLLRDRWSGGGWQGALQVAVASRSRAIHEVVARRSSPHQAIYDAAQSHASPRLSADQRVALIAHLHAGKSMRDAASHAQPQSQQEDAQEDASQHGPRVCEGMVLAGASSSGTSAHAPARSRRHRHDVDWASTLLDQLLGEDDGHVSGTDAVRRDPL